MNIFNAFLKIMKKHLKSSLIYVMIFLMIAVISTKSGGSQNTGYESTRLKVSVTDLDDTEASRAAVEFIKKGNKLVEIGDTKDERLDALYFQKADIILTIEKGYSEKLAAGNTEELFSEYSVPGTYSAKLFDSDLNRYAAMTSAYISAGETPEAAAEKASEALSHEAVVNMQNSDDDASDASSGFQSYFQYLAYIFIAAVMNGLCPIILTLYKKDTRSRINCSKLSTYDQLMQIALGTLIYVAALYGIVMISAAVLFKSYLFTTKGLLAMVNSLVFIIIAMALALLVSLLVRSEQSISMISNVIGLGMSFLCGVFVPQSLLGGTALNIGKLLPAFWYVKANNIISEKEGEVFSAGNYLICLGVQLAFAAAIMGITLVVAKNKRRSEA